jgi:hypothetical protein
MLNANAYAQLAKPSNNVSVQTYGGVDPHLFERIVQPTAQPAAALGKEQ